MKNIECQHTLDDHEMVSETRTWGLFSTVSMARCKRCGTLSRLGWLVSEEYEGPDGPELQNLGCMPEKAEAEHIGADYVENRWGRRVPSLVYHQITMKGRRFWAGHPA